MYVSFPVFLRDRDGYMCLIKTNEDLNRHIELIDVEDEEYSGWDRAGQKIKLTTRGKVIEVVSGSEIDSVGLKDALMFFSNEHLKRTLNEDYFEMHSYEDVFEYERDVNQSWIEMKLSKIVDSIRGRKKRKK